MSKVDAADHVRFLVACIKSIGTGRPDFDVVAEQLGIISKGAAQKRYERLIKAYKLDAAPAKSDKVESGDENEAAQAPKKRKAPAKSRPSPAKKVKTGANTDEDPKEGEGSDGMIDPKLDNGEAVAEGTQASAQMKEE